MYFLLTNGNTPSLKTDQPDSIRTFAKLLKYMCSTSYGRYTDKNIENFERCTSKLMCSTVLGTVN